MYKKYLTLNNKQYLICHKIKQTKLCIFNIYVYKVFGTKYPTMVDMP